VFFPHPSDCHWFFHCSNGVALCKKCPADLHWNNKLEICDFAFRAGCDATPKSPAVGPGPKSPAPVCPNGPLPECPLSDGNYSVFFRHPSDCHWFFHCSNGAAYCNKCPGDLHWNNELETCDFAFRAGCDATPKSPPNGPSPQPPTPGVTGLP
jgi:hypothetical protein